MVEEEDRVEVSLDLDSNSRDMFSSDGSNSVRGAMNKEKTCASNSEIEFSLLKKSVFRSWRWYDMSD